MTSTEYKRLEIKKFSLVASRKSADTRFWRRFKIPITVKEYAAVTDIQFSPTAPYDFAVTSSTRVQVYSSVTNTVRKTISRFKETAYSGTIRNDGKVLVAGDATGLVQLFDLNSRAILRTFRGHHGPVHVSKFSTVNTHILTASDDKSVRYWDIPTESVICTFDEHKDYVRTAAVLEENPNLIVSGAYDHTLKLWDTRENKCVMTLDHGLPVECVLPFRGGALIASAGGNKVKVWDIMAGGRALQTISNSQKTVTCLTFDGTNTRLLSGSLDNHVKVYNLQDYKVVHSIKYPSPILSLGVSPDDTRLVVGMNNGLLSIRQRVVKTKDLLADQSSTTSMRLRGGTKAYFERGANPLKANPNDLLVESQKFKRLRPYDRYLRKFQYGNALDVALSGNVEVVVVVSLLDELMLRDGLLIALSRRDDVSLEPIIKFLAKNILNPRYSVLLIDVVNVVLDLYEGVVEQSPVITDLLFRLRKSINEELKVQRDLYKLQGLMDLILSSAAVLRA
ncbi:hypothetical protein SeMB42_g01569 [Synchytrium endobioticum]|uniref:U3 small nucleolar RNA-associated protein 15 C-terminal domain-containing protein n=1 Tax=Synchytrium endobioticum TaxID=286115 RepID=A0A507DCP7_9FUNG|nr:hypothetical protein SeLEV6574_g01454 [Synchytrium endobioticum]TPX52219.1 hypothetical protein SeMB42_g01569 [Synchytrium endobioticum]